MGNDEAIEGDSRACKAEFKVSDQNGCRWHRRNLGCWWGGWGQQLWSRHTGCCGLHFVWHMGAEEASPCGSFRRRGAQAGVIWQLHFPAASSQSDGFCVLQL